jgi:putative endonuclease
MADDRANLGRRGEKLAMQFLKKLGYGIVTTNYRCTGGELDLIALDGDELVFVEVKTRRSEEAADVEEAVNPVKQRRMAFAAKHYLACKPAAQDRPCRFDILGIVCEDDRNTTVRHLPDAFVPRGLR